MIGRCAAALLLLLGLVACSDDDVKPGAPSKPRAGLLRVLAGSELADLKPILEQAKRDIGVSVEFDHAGTIDGVQQVVSGRADRRYDAIWFSSNRYLTLHAEAQTKLGTATKTMASPVVLGLRASVAKRLGWDTKAPTWADIAKAVAAKKFSYGMTSPAASNSGFSALVAVAAALSGKGSALDAQSIDKVAPQLKGFFGGQRLTAGSSGWLSDAYLRQGGSVEGLINYESVLLTLNASGKLPEPLTVVQPRDGVITADYPLTLLASAPADARESHRKLGDYLRRPDVQQRIMTQVHRRPVAPGVQPAPSFAAAPPELPFPARLDAVNALLAAYYDKIRRPSRTIYVIDVSGSMQGDRIEALRTALVALTGGDGSATGKFDRFHNREEVTLIPFSTKPRPAQSYTVPANAPDAELGRIRAFAQGLSAGGDTAIYDSLREAYRVADGQVARDPERFTSIVLMSDGENTQGSEFKAFRSAFPSLPERVRAVPVFPVLFGEAATDEMKELATLTGGRTFDARSQSLSQVFREIRGYQ